MTDDLTRNDSEALVETVDVSVSGEAGRVALVGQAAGAIDVSAPGAGEVVNISLVKGQTATLSFDATAATPVVEGNDFVLTFDTNGDGAADSRIVFLNLVEESQGADAPVLVIGGVELSAGLLIGQAQALVDGDTLETAAGAGAGPTGGGGSTYSDDLGNSIDLLNAQGVIDPTELEFGLIGGTEDITDPAQGSLDITFITTTTDVSGNDLGGISGSFAGGFEDWLPNQHVGGDLDGDSDPFTSTGGRDPESLEFYGAPMQVVFTFTPTDNETLDSVTINGIPEGAALFVGGVEFGAGDFPVTIDDADFGDVYLLPPEHSDADITFNGSGQITDPDSGETATLSFETTAIIDAVADMPSGEGAEGGENSPRGHYNIDEEGASRSAETGDPADISNPNIEIPVTYTFPDFADDSEVHELVIDFVPEDWSIQEIAGATIWQVDADGNVRAVTFAGGEPVLGEIITDSSLLPAALQFQITDGDLTDGITPNQPLVDGTDKDGFVRYIIDVSENVDDANNGNDADGSNDGTGILTTKVVFDPNDWTNERLANGESQGNDNGVSITVRAVATEVGNATSGDELTDADGTPVDENNQSVSDTSSVYVSVIEDIPEIQGSVNLTHDETVRADPGTDIQPSDEVDLSTIPDLTGQPDVSGGFPEDFIFTFPDPKVGPIGAAQGDLTYDLKTDGSDDEDNSSDGDQTVGSTPTPAVPNNGLENIAFDHVNDTFSGLTTTAGEKIGLYNDANDNIVWGIDETGVVAFKIIIGEDAEGLEDGSHTGSITFVQYVAIQHPDQGANHDEDAIDASGNPSGFDLSLGYTITDDEGDTDTGTFNIDIEDDGPVITTFASNTDVEIVLDESVGEDANDLNADDEDDTTDVDAIGYATIPGADLFTLVKDAGTDGEKSTVFNLTLNSPVSGVVHTETGQAVVLSLDSDGNVIGTVPGDQSEIVVFKIEVDTTDGSVTVTQYEALHHGDNPDHDQVNDPESILAGALELTVVVTDGDNDTTSESIELGGLIKFEDDGPANNTAAVSGTVEEDNLVDGNDEDASGSTVATGSVASLVDFGSDGAATGGGFSLASDLSNLPVLTSNGLAVTYAVAGDTLTASTTAGAVFTLNVDANGDYTFTLLDQLDHHPVASADDIEGFLDLDLSSVLVATDGDGDSVTIDDGFTIRVQDDVPVALDDALNVSDETAGNVVAGNLLQAGESAGADQPGTIREITHDAVTYELAADGQSVSGGGSFDPATGILTITTEAGATLTVDMAGDNLGDYSYEGPATHPGEDFALGGGSFDGASYTQTNPATGVTITVTGAGTEGGNPVDVLVTPAADGLGVSNIPQGTGDTPYTDNGTVQESLTFSFSDTGGAVSTDHLSFEFDGDSTAVSWSAVTADGVITGTSAPGENSFTIEGNGITSVTLTAVDPDNGFAVTQVSTAPDTLDETFDYVLEDADGDQDGATLTVTVADDNPVADIEFNEGAEIRLDETENDGDDTSTDGLLADVTVLGSALFSDSSVFGADGPTAVGATEFNLSLGGGHPVNSGLVDAQNDEAIILTQEPGGDIVGSSATGGEVFRVSVDSATGDVTVTQTRAVEHSDSNDHDEENSPAIMNSGVLQVIATVTDADGDQSDDSLDLGSVIKFEDDGPSISANNTAEPVLTVDETDLTTDASLSFAANFTSVFGADGPA
ncbi:MAG: DUF5801 repeats-in-toxin domain-containing protein, partial [Halopseudomonas aestusnigri]